MRSRRFPHHSSAQRAPRLARAERGPRRCAAATAAATLLLLASCGRPAARPYARGLAADLAPYLLDPRSGDPLARAEDLAAAARELHGRLVEGAATAAVEAEARALAAQNPEFHPAQVVAAQAALAGGRLDGARSLLRQVVSELPDYAAAQMALGRVEELRGDLVAAEEAYRAAASDSPLARARSSELGPRAAGALQVTIREAVERDRAAEAAAALARLESLAPQERSTWEAAAETRRALGDRPGELAALRWLAPTAEGERAWVERRAAAELEAGDPSIAVALLESLARRFPDDAALGAQLGSAKARWRLRLLPSHVLEISQHPELSRADLAVLLYWMLPEVRAARPTAAAIATDVHDHPHRVEILRVINLGLVPIDESLHTFSPWRPARREDALAALLRALSLRRPAPSCLAAIGLATGAPAKERALGRSHICAGAVACRWLREAADCLLAAPLSGPEFVSWATAAPGVAPGNRPPP